MKQFVHLLLPIALFSIAAALPLTSYDINSDSAKVIFEIGNLGLTVEGSVDKPSGKVVFDPADLANSSVNASVKVSAVKTGIDQRDEHLQKEEYFHASKYPTMSFRSTSISKTDKGYTAKGSLTIKGTTKTVNIPFTVSNNVFKGSFKIDRLDYGVGESSWVTSDDVKIIFELPVSTSK